MPLKPGGHGAEDVLHRRTGFELAAGEIRGRGLGSRDRPSARAPSRHRPCRCCRDTPSTSRLCQTSLPRARICCEGAGGRPMYKGAPGGSSVKKAYGCAGSERSTASSYLMYWMTARRSVERQLIPGRHRRAAHAAGDRAQQIAVGRDRLLGQPELEHGRCEVPRALLDRGRSQRDRCRRRSPRGSRRTAARRPRLP